MLKIITYKFKKKRVKGMRFCEVKKKTHSGTKVAKDVIIKLVISLSRKNNKQNENKSYQDEVERY